jgi:heme/copper-type cytochrome/quinol oxidase subunit 2
MRLLILEICALVTGGVFATMLVAIWSTRGTTTNSPADFKQSFATELVWAAIPCLMMVAAAIPALVAMASRHAGD